MISPELPTRAALLADEEREDQPDSESPLPSRTCARVVPSSRAGCFHYARPSLPSAEAALLGGACWEYPEAESAGKQPIDRYNAGWLVMLSLIHI